MKIISNLLTVCHFLVILKINRQLTMEVKFFKPQMGVFFFAFHALNIEQQIPVPLLVRYGAVEQFFSPIILVIYYHGNPWPRTVMECSPSLC